MGQSTRRWMPTTVRRGRPAPSTIVKASPAEPSPRHVADLVRQPAADADALVTEVVEQPDQLALQAGDEGAVADARNALHRALADALARAVRAGSVCSSASKAVTRPVDQAQGVDAPVEPPADAAEVEDFGEREQVEVFDAQVGGERGRDAERALHRQRRDIHAPVEHRQRQAAFEIQPLVRVARARQAPGEFAAECGPAEGLSRVVPSRDCSTLRPNTASAPCPLGRRTQGHVVEAQRAAEERDGHRRGERDRAVARCASAGAPASNAQSVQRRLRATCSVLVTRRRARETQVAVEVEEGEALRVAVDDVDRVRRTSKACSDAVRDAQLRVERAGQREIRQARGAERAGQVAIAHGREVAAVDAARRARAAWRRRRTRRCRSHVERVAVASTRCAASVQPAPSRCSPAIDNATGVAGNATYALPARNSPPRSVPSSVSSDGRGASKMR